MISIFKSSIKSFLLSNNDFGTVSSNCCGINGFNWDDKNLIKLMNKELSHRGPDNSGIYNDSSWEITKVAREKLVKGKLLGEIAFSKVSATKESLEAILSINKGECGEVEDFFKISIEKIADFNSDGIAELLLKGYRVKRSDSCSLGSGNSLGAGFSVLVQKKGATETPVVINQNME